LVINDDEYNIDAVVSPDAAYFLGIFSGQSKLYGQEAVYLSSDGKSFSKGAGYSDLPIARECYFAFVPNTVPLGVATSVFIPANKFKVKDQSGQELEDFLIGFGKFQLPEGEKEFYASLAQYKGVSGSQSIADRTDDFNRLRNSINEYVVQGSVLTGGTISYGGNYKSYFNQLLKQDGTGNVGDEASKALLDADKSRLIEQRTEYASVFSLDDSISIDARKYYEEDYDPYTSVIAGDGRTLDQAQEIWDQFRQGYHNYDSVKKIFEDNFGIDPDSTEEFMEDFKNIFFNTDSTSAGFKKFSQTQGSGRDEFAVLFSSSDINKSESAAIDFATKNLIDAPIDQGGLIEYFNSILKQKLTSFKQNFFIENDAFLLQQAGAPAEVKSSLALIKNPQQLFLVIVGIFRQAMWNDPYARAWLVLRPSRRIGIGFGQRNVSVLINGTLEM
jgi:hypothetical protein